MNAKSQGMFLCAVAALPALLSPTLAMSASANPTVTVVNTNANPVPVTGSITVGNSVVPVEVSNANPIPVNDTGAAGRQPARFGPMSNFPNQTTDLVPAVSAGKIFVVTSLNLVVDSNVSASLTSATCVLFISTGSSHLTLAYISLEPLSGISSIWASNPLLSLPLKAGEGLSIRCNGAPSPVSAIVTATGYYIPAAS